MLVGAGNSGFWIRSLGNGPVIGFSGTMRFKRSDFGFSALIGVASDEIEMMLDAEFDKTA